MHIDQMDLSGLEQAIDEAVAGGVHQANHLGALLLAGVVDPGRRDIGDFLKGLTVEELYAARLVVGHRHQGAVLGDGAADAVTRLDHSVGDLAGEQVDAAQAAIATEHEGMAGVAGELHRGVGEIPEPLDAVEDAPFAGVDHRQAASRSLHHDAEVAGAAQLGGRGRLAAGQQGEQRDGGVSLTLTQDATSIVRDRLQMLVGNGLMGLVLVVLVMSLFFRPRLALWAVLGLPAAFMGAFIVMALTGLSLNMITLVALLMAIGIVMEDAIVITDNIAAHAGEEATPLEAVVSGTRQVLPGVLSSFLTTVAVFAPLSFLAGELGAVLGLVLAIILGSAGFMAGGHLGSEVLIRLAEGDRNSLDALADLTIALPDGRRVPLEVVANAEERRECTRITRIDGRRNVTVEANVDERRDSGQADDADVVSSRWREDVGARHPEVAVSFEGQVASSAETGGSIGRGLLIGLVGIFVILSFQFRSYVEPLIVMLSIPLAFIGAIWGHVLMGYYLSMPSLIGAASLAGIVVNNAILLIHFIKTHRERGLDAVTAAGQASRDRLRAILISSTTTIAGLLPLLAETSTQAAAIKPLVISVVFGLLSATVLVLLVIPALYVLLDDWGWLRRASSSPAPVP